MTTAVRQTWSCWDWRNWSPSWWRGGWSVEGPYSSGPRDYSQWRGWTPRTSTPHYWPNPPKEKERNEWQLKEWIHNLTLEIWGSWYCFFNVPAMVHWFYCVRYVTSKCLKLVHIYERLNMFKLVINCFLKKTKNKNNTEPPYLIISIIRVKKEKNL